MFRQNRPDDLALHADTSAMDNTDLAKAPQDGLIEVFLHNNLDVAWLKRMQVQGVFDRNLVHSIQYNHRSMKFFVRTYGCQMNVADSNEMSRHFKSRGLV